MINIYRLLIILFLPSVLLFPQEKIIVLSKKVGERIEKKDAVKYHLFQSVNNFYSAVIKQKDSTFFAELEVFNGNKIIDSSFSLNYGKIITMAKLIEYDDEVNNGNYDLNKYDIKLFYADGTPVKYNLNSTALISPNDRLKKHTDLLPFVNNPERIRFKPSFSWGAGMGVFSYPYNVSESEFKKKLGITNLISSDDPGIPLMFIGFLDWNAFDIEFEAGGNSKFSKINLGVNYLFKDIINNFVTPFAGLSVSYLNFTRSYDSGDSIVVATGYKDLLLGADVHNNTLAYNIVAGVNLDKSFMGFSFDGGYTWAGKKRGAGNAEILELDLSGFYFEAKLKIYFGEY